MDNEYVKQVAETAWEQIFWSVPLHIVWSWGMSKKCYTTYNDMSTLMLKVNGLVHKGWVYISLNEGRDVYEVRLINDKGECFKTLDEVYCDNLGKTLDELVEKPSSMSQEEYRLKAMIDSNIIVLG